MDIKPTHKGTCHCGSVEFEVDLPDGLVDVHRCDCSICSRRGAIVGAVPLAGLRVTKGEDVLELYQFNTMTAKHYFCGTCGIYTHHQRRSKPHEYSFNIACLEGIRAYDLGEVPVTDGINHPKDRNPPA
jgi:hypothetical protein